MGPKATIFGKRPPQLDWAFRTKFRGSLVPVEPEPEDTFDVWLALGDSEMAGAGSQTEGLPDCYPPTDGLSFMVHTIDGTAVEPLAEPDQVGPDGMFCWFRSRQTGRATCVVRAAVSATNSTYYAPDANPSSPYQKVLAAVGVALAEPDAVFRGFLLYGGANDASLASPDWATNWGTTLDALRTDIAGAASVPMLYAQLPNGTPHSNYSTSWATVRAQQAGWQAADRIMIAVNPAGPWVNDPQNATNADYLIHQRTEAAAATARAFAEALGPVPDLPLVAPGDVPDLVFDTRVFTNSSGSVDALTDPDTGLTFAGTGTSRPAYSASDANWAGAPSGTWDGVNDTLDYSGSLADLACLHDGTGGTLSLVFRNTAANSDVFLTWGVGSAPGILIRIQSGVLTSYVYPASGFTQYHGNAPTTNVPDGECVVVQFRLEAGRQAQRVNGQAWQEPSFYNAVTLSPDAPGAGKLCFPTYYPFAGQIQRAVLHNRFLTDAEANAVANALMVGADIALD